MIRQISYRTASYAFLIAFFWLVFGAVALWSPVPSALGIAWEFFGAWVVLFFLIVAAAGSTLTIAALNGLVEGHGGGPSRTARPATGPAPWAAGIGTPQRRRSSARRQG